MDETKEPGRYQLPECMAEQQLVSAYVRSEQVLLARLGGGMPQFFIDKAIGDRDKILSEVSEAGIFGLSTASEDKRQEMKVVALIASRNFWTQKMQEPSLSPIAAALGRKRIDTINQKLEALTKPPQNSQ